MADGKIILGFDRATRKQRIPLPTRAYAANQSIYVELPSVGFISKVVGILTLNVTTAATGTYANKVTRTKAGGVTPYDAINRIRIYSNDSVEIWNTSGWGAYLKSRIGRSVYDQRNTLSTYDATNAQQGSYLVPTTYTTSTGYVVRIPVFIDLSHKESNYFGLLLAQNNSIKYTCQIDFGDFATNGLTLGGTTPSITVTGSFESYAETYSVPADRDDWPDISRIHQVTESIMDITGTGDVTHQLITGPIYLNVIDELVSSGAGLTPAQVSRITVQYANSQVPENLSANLFLLDQERKLASRQLPDGVFWHAWENGVGIPEVFSIRDVADTSYFTDYRRIYNLPASLTPTGAYLRTIREYLTPSQYAF